MFYKGGIRRCVMCGRVRHPDIFSSQKKEICMSCFSASWRIFGDMCKEDRSVYMKHCYAVKKACGRL